MPRSNKLKILKVSNKLDSFHEKLGLKTAKPSCLLQVVGGVVVADQDEALKFAAAVKPGLDVFR